MAEFRPAETLYESRLFEAIHRVGFKEGLEPRILRQPHIRCHGCENRVGLTQSNHKKGKLWIPDFIVGPDLILEVDGHPINQDRELCFLNHGFTPLHFKNEQLWDMDDAMRIASMVRDLADFRSYQLKGNVQYCSRLAFDLGQQLESEELPGHETYFDLGWYFLSTGEEGRGIVQNGQN